MRSVLRNGWTIAFVSFLVTTAVFTPQIWFPFFFVDLQNDFNATAVQTGWLGSVLWGSSLLLSPVSAVLEQYLGVKIVCFIGTVLTPISYFLSSIVNSIYLLYLTFGVTYGLCVCLVQHSSLRMFYSIYDERNSQRALTLIFIGQFAGAVAGNGTVQRLLATKGWRMTLRYIAGMVAITIPLPLVFYRQGKDTSALKITSSPTSEVKSLAEPVTVDSNPEGLSNPTFETEKEGKVEKGIEGQSDADISGKELRKRNNHIPSLQSFLSIPDTWFISIAYFFTFSALAVYQVNFVSHFESMENLSPGDVWLIMTVTNTIDVVTRFFIMLIGGNFLCRPVYVIIASTLILGLASLSYSFLSSVWVLVTVSLCTTLNTKHPIVFVEVKRHLGSTGQTVRNLANTISQESGGQSSTEASVGQTMKTLETQLPASQEANLGLISCTVKWWATVSTIFDPTYAFMCLWTSFVATMLATDVYGISLELSRVYYTVLMSCPLCYGIAYYACLVLGFARSTTVVMSWHVVINLLGVQYADYVVTMVMYLQGFGYILGTLTPGALFDATGSYDLAFQFISLCFLVASGILTFVAAKSSRRIKTRKLSSLEDSSETPKPRLSLVSYQNNAT